MAANLTNTRPIWTLRDEMQRETLIESMMADPSIGELCRNGTTVYYVIVDGVRHERRTLYAIAERLLDLRNGGRTNANGVVVGGR